MASVHAGLQSVGSGGVGGVTAPAEETYKCRCGRAMRMRDLKAHIVVSMDRGEPYRCPACGDASAWIAARTALMQTGSVMNTVMRTGADEADFTATEALQAGPICEAATAVASGVYRGESARDRRRRESGAECAIPYCGESGPLVLCCGLGKHSMHAACLKMCISTSVGKACPLCRNAYMKGLLNECVAPLAHMDIVFDECGDPYGSGASAKLFTLIRLDA